MAWALLRSVAKEIGSTAPKYRKENTEGASVDTRLGSLRWGGLPRMVDFPLDAAPVIGPVTSGRKALFARFGRECNAVAMGADLALDYFAGAQGISCLARYELSAIIAVRTFLLPNVLVLND